MGSDETLWNMFEVLGLVADEHREAAQARQEELGGSPDTAVFEVALPNAADREAFLDGLAQAVGLPRATPELLANPNPSALGFVPAPLAVRNALLPVQVSNTQLTVVMAYIDPTVLTELAFTVGRRIDAYLADELSVREALRTHLGVPIPRRFTRLATALEDHQAREAGPDDSLLLSVFAGNRDMSPKVWIDAVQQAASQAWADDTRRDILAQAGAGFIANRFYCIIDGEILVVIGGSAAANPDHVYAGVRIPLKRRSLLSRVLSLGSSRVGPWRGEASLVALYDALSRPHPRSVLVEPIRIKHKIVGLLVADDGDRMLNKEDRKTIRALVRPLGPLLRDLGTSVGALPPPTPVPESIELPPPVLDPAPLQATPTPAELAKTVPLTPPPARRTQAMVSISAPELEQHLPKINTLPSPRPAPPLAPVQRPKVEPTPAPAEPTPAPAEPTPVPRRPRFRALGATTVSPTRLRSQSGAPAEPTPVEPTPIPVEPTPAEPTPVPVEPTPIEPEASTPEAVDEPIAAETTEEHKAEPPVPLPRFPLSPLRKSPLSARPSGHTLLGPPTRASALPSPDGWARKNNAPGQDSGLDVASILTKMRPSEPAPSAPLPKTPSPLPARGLLSPSTPAIEQPPYEPSDASLLDGLNLDAFSPYEGESPPDFEQIEAEITVKPLRPENIEALGQPELSQSDFTDLLDDGPPVEPHPDDDFEALLINTVDRPVEDELADHFDPLLDGEQEQLNIEASVSGWELDGSEVNKSPEPELLVTQLSQEKREINRVVQLTPPPNPTAAGFPVFEPQATDAEEPASPEALERAAQRLLGHDGVDPASVKLLIENGRSSIEPIMAIFPGTLLVDRYTTPPAAVPVSKHSVLLDVVCQLGSLIAPELINRLEHLSPADRDYAVFCFSEIHYPAAVSRIGARLFDKDPDVRTIATYVVDRYRTHPVFDEVVNQLRLSLSHGRPSVRRTAAQIVGALRAAGAAKELLSALSAPQPPLVEAAHRALVEVMSQDFGIDRRKWTRWYEANRGRSQMEWLIDGLNSTHLNIRISSVKKLRALTKQHFNFEPAGPIRQRVDAHKRWLKWWNDSGQEQFVDLR